MSQLFSVAPFETVTPFDPAIDLEACNVEKYMNTRDMSSLVYLAGQQPTIFTVRRLPVSRSISIRSTAHSDAQARSLAFMAAVVRVQNIRTDAGVMPSWEPGWKRPGSTAQHESMTVAELDEGLFAEDEIMDVGEVVLQRANLRNGRPALFPPLPSSAHALALRIISSRHAEPTDLP